MASLKELYENASTTTNPYVNSVKTQQEEQVGAGAAESFMDGDVRAKYNGTRILASSDAYQTEFTRNAAAAYKAGGAQAPALANSTALNNDAGTKTNTRWTNKAFKFAFDGTNQGPSGLPNGYYRTADIFRKAKNSKGTVSNVHNYTPSSVYTAATTGGYINQNEFARNRYNASGTSR